MAAYADDRREHELALAEKWGKSAAKRRAQSARFAAQGKPNRAKHERIAAEKADKLYREHLQAAKDLECPANLAAALRRKIAAENERVKAEVAARAEAKVEEVPLTPRERRLAEKRESARLKAIERAAADAERAKRQAQAYQDPRTAGGQREIEVRGPASGVRRAMIATHGRLIHRTTDRTMPRIRAAEKIDRLWHAAHAGTMKGPDLSSIGGGGGSRRQDFQPEGDAYSMQQLDALKGALGFALWSVAVERIVNGLSFTVLEQRGVGGRKDLGQAFLAALDKAAVHFGYAEPPREKAQAA